MAQLILGGLIDADEFVVRSDVANQSLDSVAGILARRKSYLLKDSFGQFSPLSSRGLFFRNAFKGFETQEINDVGDTTLKAQVTNVDVVKQRSFKTQVDVVDPTQILLKWPTDENDSLTFDGYEVDAGGAAVGAFDVPVVYTGAEPGDLPIPVPARITFDADLVPAYEVTDTVNGGSPVRTSSIKLNAPLVEALTAGQAVRVSVPKVETGPRLLINAFTALGIADRLDSTFFIQDDIDEALGLKLWVHVRREDKISLATHIANILELCDLYLSANDNGTLSLIRGLEFKGFQPEQIISDKELLDGYRITRDDDKLIVGYDVLFRSGSKVVIESDDAPDELVQEFKGFDRWQPIKTRDNNIMSYKYLYADSSSAVFFADRILLYRSYPRWTLRGRMKRFFHDEPTQFILPQLFKQYSLTCATTQDGDFLVNEPVFVKRFSEKDEAKTIEIELQLNNFLSPNLPLDKTLPSDITSQIA